MSFKRLILRCDVLNIRLFITVLFTMEFKVISICAFISILPTRSGRDCNDMRIMPQIFGRTYVTIVRQRKKEEAEGGQGGRDAWNISVFIKPSILRINASSGTFPLCSLYSCVCKPSSFPTYNRRKYLHSLRCFWHGMDMFPSKAASKHLCAGILQKRICWVVSLSQIETSFMWMSN